LCPGAAALGRRVRIEGVIRRATALLVSLACCFALAACNGNKSDPKTVDGIPAYAAANTPQGAQGFARYWITTLNKATVDGKTAKLRSLQKKSCTTCTDFANQLDTMYSKGGHVETKGFKVKKILNDSGIPKPGAGVSVVLTATPQTVVASKGATPKHLKGGDLRLRLIMVREKSHWVMDRIDIG
jgi:hypothetical protein